MCLSFFYPVSGQSTLTYKYESKSLFALRGFDWGNPRQIIWFSATMITIAACTYILAALMIWLTRQDTRWKFVADAFRRVGFEGRMEGLSRKFSDVIERIRG